MSCEMKRILNFFTKYFAAQKKPRPASEPASERSQLSDSHIQAGDYYIDQNGLYVFTESYLRRRGFCCKNGCRHCPYGYSSGHKG